MRGKPSRLWFPCQKLAFLPAGTPDDVIATYTQVIEAVRSRGDFAEISARVGKYDVFVGEGARAGYGHSNLRLQVHVTQWLKDDYGVELEN